MDGTICGRWLLPHPPAAVEAVGGAYREKIAATVGGMEKAAARIADPIPSSTSSSPSASNCLLRSSTACMSPDSSSRVGQKSTVMPSTSHRGESFSIFQIWSSFSYRPSPVPL